MKFPKEEVKNAKYWLFLNLYEFFLVLISYGFKIECKK